MTLFVMGLVVGGFIGAAVMAVLSSGKQTDIEMARQDGYANAMAEVHAKHQARGIKAAQTRRSKA